MKKLYFVLFLLFLIIPFTQTNTHFARAEGVYMRVINETTPFYKNEYDDKPMFYLPYTYYVKILENKSDFIHIECYDNLTPTIDGYVPKNMLFDDSLPVSFPYLSLSLTTLNNCTFYLDSECTTPLRYIFANRIVSYYGIADKIDNEVVYCVNYNGQMGYLKESDIKPFTFSNHPNKLTFIKENESTTSQSNTNISSLKIIIISCLVFAGIIALVIAFNPKSKKKKDFSYYDENDWE